MTTDSPEPLRERYQIEADLSALEFHRMNPGGVAGESASMIGYRLLADVGPLLERLDQAEKDVNEWKDWEARARGRADDLQQRLDQQTAEIERLRAEADEAFEKGFEQVRRRCVKAEAELAAAQAQIADVETLRDLWLASRDSYARWAGEVLANALAGDAARPLPEPEQPQHQRLSSFGDPYCGACKKDWPCPDACDAEVVCDRLPDV